MLVDLSGLPAVLGQARVLKLPVAIVVPILVLRRLKKRGSNQRAIAAGHEPVSTSEVCRSSACLPTRNMHMHCDSSRNLYVALSLLWTSWHL